MQKNDFIAANAELVQASQMDPKDPWAHYYSALMKYQQVQLRGGSTPGLPNMMQDLRTVIDWNPDFAEAYNMLAMARLEGGGTHSAMDAIRPAIQLSPRNEAYLLNLAHIDIGIKKWDDADDLLNRLKTSANPQIARAAQKDLQDLPTLKKYGLLPQEDAAAKPKIYSSQDSGESGDSESDSAAHPAADVQPDKRPVKFLKGTLQNVDCSHPPAAVLTLSSAGKTLKLRTPDYKALVLIGADKFSCEWKRQTVAVNFKASGKSDGDLVSLELQ